jgi:hypothetical protein
VEESTLRTARVASAISRAQLLSRDKLATIAGAGTVANTRAETSSVGAAALLGRRSAGRELSRGSCRGPRKQTRVTRGRTLPAKRPAVSLRMAGKTSQGTRESLSLDHQRHLRTPFSAPPNLYQASFFKFTQCSALCVGLDAPVLQHKVGNDKGVSHPKPPDVPEREPDQQSFHAKMARLTHPRDIYGSRNKLPSNR